MLDRFTELLEKEVKNGSIYVWGGQGQKATDALIDKLETSADNKKTAKALLKKRKAAGYKNIRAFDCSGLITKLMDEAGIEKKGFDATAQTLRKSYCTDIKRSQLRPGDLVFRRSLTKTYHAGVVVDDELNVIEAMGRAYGVVKRKLNASGAGYWNAYGRPVKLTDEIEAGITITRLLKKKAVYIRGEDVRLVQKKLIAKGYSCGSDGADGIFGRNTDKAVRSFQKANKLTVDGIVGKNTAGALGLVFKEE